MMVKRVSLCFSDESSADKSSLLIGGAQYFKSVTSGSYDLSEICEEYRVQAENANEKDTVLPERVESRVHLRLEIKNTNLDPVLVKVLQSGIAVYLSPFKDIYGSRMIFAGPHKSFQCCISFKGKGL